jgi:hypothetical protein
MSDYLKFRGKCKEYSELACQNDSSLVLCRGYYYCPIWNKQMQHWWTVRPDGSIFDPTKDQFPSKGNGIYELFSGVVDCCMCDETISEDQIYKSGSWGVVCSGRCYGRLVFG